MLGGIYRFGAGPGAVLQNYLGTWDANANNPSIASGVGSAGDWYIVSVAGNTTVDGQSDWAVGDMIIFNGAINQWEKIDNSDNWVEDTNGIFTTAEHLGLGGTASEATRAIALTATGTTGIRISTSAGANDSDFIGATNAYFDLIGGTGEARMEISGATLGYLGAIGGTGDGYLVVDSTGGSAFVQIGAATAPGDTGEKLYNLGGVLYWNGFPLGGTGSGLWTVDTNGLTTTSSHLGVNSASNASYALYSAISGQNGLYLYSSGSGCANTLKGFGQTSLEVNSENSDAGFTVYGKDSSTVTIQSASAGESASLGLVCDGGGSAFIDIEQGSAPGTTTDRLYNLSGVLTWNGSTVQTSVPPERVSWTVRGVAVAAANQMTWISPVSGTVGTIYAKVGTAPTDADLNIDINKNGTSIFSTNLTIAASATTGNETPSTTAISAGDVLTLDVDQVGSTVAGGSDLWVYFSITPS